MLYALYCVDKPNSLQIRLANRAAHLAYVAKYASQLFMAGPLVSETDRMQGSLLIMEFENLDAAELFAANDPYRHAGLFESVTISGWRKTLPDC